MISNETETPKLLTVNKDNTIDIHLEDELIKGLWWIYGTATLWGPQDKQYSEGV